MILYFHGTQLISANGQSARVRISLPESLTESGASGRLMDVHGIFEMLTVSYCYFFLKWEDGDDDDDDADADADADDGDDDDDDYDAAAAVDDDDDHHPPDFGESFLGGVFLEAPTAEHVILQTFTSFAISFFFFLGIWGSSKRWSNMAYFEIQASN